MIQSPDIERRSYVVAAAYKILNVPQGKRVFEFRAKIPSLSRDDKFFGALKTCAIDKEKA